MHNYPSDITREQFEIIRPDQTKRKTRPSDLYDIFCAVLYILRGGMEDAAERLSKLEIGLLLLYSLVNRNWQTSFVIIDSKSIKNTDTAKEKGFDAGKKVSGIKLHLAVNSKQCT